MSRINDYGQPGLRFRTHLDSFFHHTFKYNFGNWWYLAYSLIKFYSNLLLCICDRQANSKAKSGNVDNILLLFFACLVHNYNL